MATQEAWTISHEAFWPHLHIGDAIITASNQAAADLYGFASPKELNGQFISQLRLPEDNDLSRLYWTLREHGHEAPQGYASRIIRPDGEEIWHQRTFGQKLEDGKGRAVFLTRLGKVSQPDLPKLPVLEDYGLDQDDVNRAVGEFTVSEYALVLQRQAQDFVHSPETFSTMVANYGGLSRLLADWFLGEVSVSLETGKIRYKKTCHRCHYTWMARVNARRPQCPECTSQIQEVC